MRLFGLQTEQIVNAGGGRHTITLLGQGGG